MTTEKPRDRTHWAVKKLRAATAKLEASEISQEQFMVLVKNICNKVPGGSRQSQGTIEAEKLMRNGMIASKAARVAGISETVAYRLQKTIRAEFHEAENRSNEIQADSCDGRDVFGCSEENDGRQEPAT